jgi:hypothetical protein
LARFQAYVATPTGKKTVMGLGAVGAVVAGLWVRARNKATGDTTSAGTATTASLAPSSGGYSAAGGSTGGGISGEAITDSINALGTSLAQGLGDALAAANAQQSATSAQQQSVLDSIAQQLTALQTAQTAAKTGVSGQKPSLGTPAAPTGVVTGQATTQADVDAFLRSMANAVNAKVGVNASQATKDAAARQIIADAQAKAAPTPVTNGTIALWGNKAGAAARKPS